MSNEAKKLGAGLLVQWGLIILAGGVAWGTLRAAQLNLETRVTKSEQIISIMVEQRGELREALVRFEERLKSVQRDLQRHTKEQNAIKDYEP